MKLRLWMIRGWQIRCWRAALTALLVLAALAAGAALPAVAQQSAAQQGAARPAAQPAPDDGYRVVHVTFGSAPEVNRLAGALDVWTVDYHTHTLVAYASAAQVQALRDQGYFVLVDAAGDALRDLTGSGPAGVGAASIPSFACYRTVQETYTDLAKLAADHPKLAQWTDIGDSWLKVSSGGAEGNDLYVLVLTNQEWPGPKPKLFVMAAIHARELATAEIATRFAEQLVNGYGSDPDITWLLDYNEIHIVAQANPDGRQKTEAALPSNITNPNDQLWRKNVNNTDGCTQANSYGVDLNRNFEFKWAACESGSCSTSNACWLTYRGHAAASEPETAAIQTYLRKIFPDQRGPNLTDAAPADTAGVMISLHSFAQKVLFPWGWSGTPSPNDAGLRTLARKFGYYTRYEACQAGEDQCLYQTDGTTDDFSYGELGVASYTFEVGTAFYQSCGSFTGEVLPDTLKALLYAAKSARLPYQTPAGPEVVALSTRPDRVTPGSTYTLTVQLDATHTITADPNFGGQPVQPIAGARYSVDAPSWDPAAVITGTLQPVDAFDQPTEQARAVIDTTGWTTGQHTIFVEAQDTTGAWGPPTAFFVNVEWTVWMPWMPNTGQKVSPAAIPALQIRVLPSGKGSAP